MRTLKHLGEADTAESQLLELGIGDSRRQSPEATITEHEAILHRQRRTVAGDDVEPDAIVGRHSRDEVAVELLAVRPVREVAGLAARPPVRHVQRDELVEAGDGRGTGQHRVLDMEVALQVAFEATVVLPGRLAERCQVFVEGGRKVEDGVRAEHI